MPDRSRSGALWVTATGAFLLLAAATLFVAVRWDTLGDQVKLAILAGVTGAGLLAGRLLRPTLPVTARVLTHLGALLVPLDVAAVALHIMRDSGVEPLWPPVLALTAGSAVLTWWAAGRAERAPLLTVLAAVAVVPAGAGVAGTFGWSAAALVVAVAVGALVVDARRLAVALAAVAGLGPVLAIVAGFAELPRAATGLGLDASASGWVPAVVGVVAAGVLAVVARRQDQPSLLLVALASLVVAGGALRSGADASGAVDVLALVAIILGVELGALISRDDPFWGCPTAGLADVVEVLHALALGAAVLVAGLLAVFGDDPDRALVQAGALAAVAWLVADVRRGSRDQLRGPADLLVGSGWAPATPLAAASLLVGVVAGTASGLVVGVVAIILSGVLVVSGRPLGHAVAAVIAPLGVVAVATADAAGEALAAGTFACLALVVAARVRRHRGGADDEGWAFLLALQGVLAPLLAQPVAHEHVGLTASLVTLAMTWWVAGVILDGPTRVVPGLAGSVDEPDARGATAEAARSRATARVVIAMVPRVAVTLLVAGVALAVAAARAGHRTLTSGGYEPEVLVVVAGTVLMLALVDVARRLRVDRATPVDAAVPAVLAIPALVAGGLWVLGYSTPIVGVGLATTALVAVGLGLLVPPTWRPLTLGTAVVAAAGGIAAALGEPASLATVLLLVGGATGAEAVVRRSGPLSIAAGSLVTAGVWGHLGVAGIEATDAWAAPVALGLAVAGAVTARRGASSWITVAPAVALLGGTAVAERMAGGGGGHALVAGVVGVVAVAVGGVRRLAAPLLLGTGILVVLTLSESMRYTAGVPTWTWLALGGSTLVGVGIVLERHETGPLEVGERLVDVVRTRYR